MRTVPALAAACLVLTAGCGSSGPETARHGPRLEAELVAEWPTESPARQVAFSRDGRLLATSETSGRIAVRETGGWTKVIDFTQPGGTASLVFGKDGASLFSGGYDGMICVWDLATRKLANTLKGAQRTVWSLDLSPDGTRLAAAGEDHLIRIWPLNHSESPTVLRGHQLNVWQVRFSPDGTRVASGSFDKTVRLWDAATGRLLKTMRDPQEAVVGLDYSRDGSLLATGGDDSTIRLWRAADGKLLRTIASDNHIYSVAFTPDGRWLASGGRARGGFGTFWHQQAGGGGQTLPAQIWRVSDGALVARLPHLDDVVSIAFSPNARWLVTSSEDKRVRLWRVGERSRS